MRRVIVRLAFAMGAVTVLALPITSASAQNIIYDTQYCAREFDGAMDCSYFTLRQCLAAVSATGGDCAVNPRYIGDRGSPYRKARRRF
ncbi:DUF3551 domain-containing protein [Pseudorhodoplanes sp.]|uniref:DUF3551 domain-containing protein n=1 Tax=Pseudorhodoplanes sp. TaxID=1934341 RepID=UPI002C438760|nr:DUF3551 domain-containing protein [Pseudorhodoplanes sp.]HWV44330.1 DUF3551 domain-containing protein [Pseudorhodoplanes sp.]